MNFSLAGHSQLSSGTDCIYGICCLALTKAGNAQDNFIPDFRSNLILAVNRGEQLIWGLMKLIICQLSLKCKESKGWLYWCSSSQSISDLLQTCLIFMISGPAVWDRIATLSGQIYTVLWNQHFTFIILMVWGFFPAKQNIYHDS